MSPPSRDGREDQANEEQVSLTKAHSSSEQSIRETHRQDEKQHVDLEKNPAHGTATALDRRQTRCHDATID